MSKPKWTPGTWLRAGLFGTTIFSGKIEQVREVCECIREPLRDDIEAVANARLISAAPELYEALYWALPLANLALESHRQERLQAGHNDIGKGTERLGLWPEEQEKYRKAVATLAKARGETEGEKG